MTEIKKGREFYQQIKNSGKEPHVPTVGIQYTKEPHVEDSVILSRESR